MLIMLTYIISSTQQLKHLDLDSQIKTFIFQDSSKNMLQEILLHV